MAENGVSLPYAHDASMNAVFLLQKQVFQYQTSCLGEILREVAPCNVYVNGDLKVPQFILNRALPDEYIFQGRSVDNEEMTLLGFIDSNGKLSSSSRLSEFMLFMTRIKKAEHRGLCIHVLSSKIDEEREKEFTRFGGLRIVKRWLRNAEEGDNISEMVALVKLCKKLPFDEAAIREVGIGKVIRKLLKFQSPSGGDVGPLHTQVEGLMSLWRAKQQEVGSKPAPVKEVLKVAEPSGLVVALAERLAVQRGRPADTPTHAPSTSPRSLERGDSTESKSAEHEYRRSTPMDFEAVLTPKLPTPKSLSHSADGRAPSQSNPTQLPPKPLSQAQPILSLLQRSPQASVEPSEVTGAAPATPVALIKAPAVVRERKPLDMAESARKLLAMRAQQAASGAQSSADADGNNSDGGGAGTMSPSAANVLSILSAVGKARIAGGLLRTETAPQIPAAPLRGALKKATADGAKKEKKVIHWADENGGLLREVQIIEVAKIKRSTAHYSSTRELSKRERLAEKETHLSKAEDAMQRNTEWRTPQPLVLSIVVLDNISIVADSAEKVAQEKRLAHLLEVRYHDDSQIPADPDEAPSAFESSSSSGRGGTDGTGAGDDTCAVIPWYIPGTEPPPEEIAAPAPVADSLGNGYNGHFGPGPGGYLDDAAIIAILPKLPYGLQMLDIHALRILIQDPALLQSVLRLDGQVNEVALSAFLRGLGADALHGRGHFGGNGAPSYPDAGPRRSRWGGGDPLPGDAMRGGVDPYSRPAPAQYEFDYDYDPYGAPRASGGFGDRPPAQNWGGDYLDQPPRGPDLGGPPRSSLAGQKRFPTTKASTPCRFFNTPKGCQFGDKCSFGHFLGVRSLAEMPPLAPVGGGGGIPDSFAPPEMPDRVNSRWGGGPASAPAAVPMGPGRNSRFGGPGRSGPGSMASSLGGHSVAPPVFVPPPVAAVQGTLPLPGSYDPAAAEEPDTKRKKRFH